MYQFCAVLELWEDSNVFPVVFYPFPSIDSDETALLLETLNKLTPDVHDLFEAIHAGNS